MNEEDLQLEQVVPDKESRDAIRNQLFIAMVRMMGHRVVVPMKYIDEANKYVVLLSAVNGGFEIKLEKKQ